MSDHFPIREPSMATTVGQVPIQRFAWLLPIAIVLSVVAYFVWQHYRITTNRSHGELLLRVYEVDEEARTLYQSELDAVAAGTQTNTQLAERVREQIVPGYDQLATDLQAFDPRDDRGSEIQASLLEYVALVTDGWELLAEARERQNIIREGESIEKFEAARAIMVSLGVEVEVRERNLHAEIALFLLADQRAEAGFSERFQSEGQSDVETADAVEREVLPDWEQAVQRFLAASSSPPVEYQRSVGQLQHYADLRTEAFHLALESLRESDEAKTTQAAALLAEAQNVAAEIMAQGLVE